MNEMKITIQQYLFGICLLVFFAFNMLLLGGCNDDTEMEMIDSSQKNVISLSIPDAELVQVRSVANESECRLVAYRCLYIMILTPHPLYIIRRVKLICLFCSVMALHRRL